MFVLVCVCVCVWCVCVCVCISNDYGTRLSAALLLVKGKLLAASRLSVMLLLSQMRCLTSH